MILNVRLLYNDITDFAPPPPLFLPILSPTPTHPDPKSWFFGSFLSYEDLGGGRGAKWATILPNAINIEIVHRVNWILNEATISLHTFFTKH